MIMICPINNYSFPRPLSSSPPLSSTLSLSLFLLLREDLHHHCICLGVFLPSVLFLTPQWPAALPLLPASSSHPHVLVSSSVFSAPPTAQHSAHSTAPAHLTFFVATTHRSSAGTKPPRDSSRQPPRVHALHLQPP
ncbi:hypothetical protein RIF29_24476 [Crotalaria pallida]|uniref:Uncharacterized protein n=1 Tax=Crotalaria pallida TaxID=3830 RepID=A0AAN9EJR2_CROPI